LYCTIVIRCYIIILQIKFTDDSSQVEERHDNAQGQVIAWDIPLKFDQCQYDGQLNETWRTTWNDFILKDLPAF